MPSESRHKFATPLRVVIALVCLLAIWYSFKLIRASSLVKEDTPDALRSALWLEPDSSAIYMRLAQLDETNAQQLLETAVRLDPYNAQADIELGLRYESAGDPARAEQSLLQAFAVDHTYVTRWTLANFYLRQGNMPAFWMWARRSAQMPSDDIGALFQLCWRVSPDPNVLTANLISENPSIIRQYLVFLMNKGQFDAAIPIAMHLIRVGSVDADRRLLLAVVNQLVAAKVANGSLAIWHQLLGNKWITADSTVPNNSAFAREPLPVSFDWSIRSFAGLHSWPGPSGLETEFAGNEPENCTITEQTIALTPGNFTLNYTYHTTGIPAGSGIHWQIVDATTETVLAQSADLSSDTVQKASLDFTVGPDAPLLRLRLVYKRELGTTRITGMMETISTQIVPRA